MGLSASQARLLSITARLTHNETESQLITNSKLRLSDKSAEASEDYIEALNSTQYLYSYYDSTGSKAYYDLTVGNVTQFSEIKNQYGFVDAQGRLLVSETDAANFENSDTLADFLSCYGVTNEEDTDALTSLYGSNYENYYDSDDIYEWYNMINNTISGYSAEDLYDETKYNTLSDAIKALSSDSATSALLTNSDGLFQNVVSALSSMPAYDTIVAAENYLASSTTCYSEVLDEVANLDYEQAAIHIEHNLSALIWGDNGLASYASSLSSSKVTDNGDGTYTITSSSGISVTSVLASDNSGNCSLSSSSSTTFNSSESGNALITALLSDPNSSQLIQDLIDLYCNTVAYLQANFTSYSSANVSGTTSLTAEEIYNDWDQWYDDLGTDTAFSDWLNEVNEALEDFKEELDNVITIDTTDTKYQWYVNLWYRMGGKTASSKVSNPQNYYKVLGDEYMYNSDWLKFALEHGIVTMEQVQYQEEGESTAEEMNQYAWTSITYTSCADLTEESDETAIAKAEAEYEQISAEIQAKDKKYDNDLKDLDTEHDALQTEYDSIKSVIEKNVERSFKAFS